MSVHHTTITGAISGVAAQQPQSIALVHDEQSYTYKQLECYSAQIAAQLLAEDVQAGESVALCVDRSIHAVAAMLGVFKAGAVFVPLDPSFPEDRLSYMVEDAGIRTVLCAPHYQQKFNFGNLSVLTLAALPLEVIQTSSILRTPEAEDRAYIMYTSGSTGKPKGVPISHRALMNYCIADAQVYELQPDDRTLQFSTLSFDIAIEEIFPPLLVGSTVVMRPSERSTAQIELSDIVETFGITALHMATGYWHEWVDLMNAANVRVPATIRLMVVTGEKVSPEHYHRWQSLTDQPVLWANAYGPTEATVTATVFIPPEGWQGKALPIGKPLLNYTAYILNDKKELVEPGETGELFIGGPSLAEGYLNRPDLTANAFFPDPFSAEPDAQMYRTGDLARWMDDGNIDYAGRIDHQIKVGSYRIEPGEIENAINEHDDVKEVIVTADEIAGKKMLLAYVASDNADLSAADISNYLKASLPIYMVPARYVLLQNLPKTLNGKIDRKALPDSSEAVAPKSHDYKAPEGEVQEKLCQIWSDILGVPEVGSEDSFISMGGDSLLAVRTISRIQSDLDFTISTRDFFYLDTVALLAGYIEGKAVERVVPAPIPGIINKRGRQVYTVLQTAKQEIANGIGVLIVPPLGNEQRRTQRPFRLLMQNLARQGFTTLRFDWTGTANSSGNAEQISCIDEWCNDIKDAAAELAKTCNTVDVISIRAGALIAAQTDLSQLPIRQRYYWDPVISGERWLEEMTQLQTGILNDAYRFLQRRKKNTGPHAEFAGISISQSMQTSLRSADFMTSLSQHAWNRDTHVVLADARDKDQYEQTSCTVHTVTEDSDNDWTDERKTTIDMQINKAASTLADLLVAEPITNPSAVDAASAPISNAGHASSIHQDTSAKDLITEHAISFGDESQLLGVYTPAMDSSNDDICVLYLTAGLLHHVGPTRVHVEIARALSNQQVAGFRFDLSGIGDSETSSLGGYFAERSVAEVRAAMDFMQSEYGHKRFVLLGLCSGADDALATAQKDSRVTGVVLLNGYAYQAGKYKLYRIKEFYLPRLLMLDKWKNKLKKLMSGEKPEQAPLETTASDNMSDEERAAVIALDDDYRYIPPKAETGRILDTLTSDNVHLYFIYNGSEHDVYTYEGQLVDTFPEQRSNSRLKEGYIKEADHTFILQQDRDKLTQWLMQWFDQTEFNRR
jgi:amino acid adenylation domain-containing protein